MPTFKQLWQAVTEKLAPPVGYGSKQNVTYGAYSRTQPPGDLDPFERLAYETYRQKKIIDGEAATAIHEMMIAAYGWNYEHA